MAERIKIVENFSHEGYFMILLKAFRFDNIWLTNISFKSIEDKYFEMNHIIICPEGVYLIRQGEARDITEINNYPLLVFGSNVLNIRDIKLSADVMILEKGRIVLFHNKDTGYYSTCGGHGRNFEKEEEIASRELFEETCATIRIPPSDIAKLPSKNFGGRKVFFLNIDHFDEYIFYKNLEALKANGIYKSFLEMDGVIKVDSEKQLKLNKRNVQIFKHGPIIEPFYRLKLENFEYKTPELKGIISFTI